MKMKCIKISLLIVSALSVNFSFAQWTEDASGVHLTDPNKYVGIGTSKPSAQLDVNNNILLGLDEPAYGVRIKANWPSHTGGWARGFYIANEDNSKNYFSVGVTGLATAGVTNMSYAWLGKDYNNAHMFFLPNGNVGIGTANPTEKLSVNGNITVKGDNARIYLGGPANGTFGIAFDNLNPNYGIFYTEGTPDDYVSISPNGNAKNGVMNIFGNGNVGIGTTTPQEKLDVNGNVTISGLIKIPLASDVEHQSPSLTVTPGHEFKYDGEYLNYYGLGFHKYEDAGGFDGINAYLSAYYGIDLFTGGANRLRISNGGNVGIGTTTPTEKLSVNGNIKAKKLIVTQTGWADYVFDKAYTLMHIDSLSTYINTHKHLPEMPTTKDVQDNGVDVGNNQTLLLKKIEELTLYIIEQHKQMAKQNEQMIQQQKEITEQNQRIEKLEHK